MFEPDAPQRIVLFGQPLYGPSPLERFALDFYQAVIDVADNPPWAIFPRGEFGLHITGLLSAHGVIPGATRA